MGGDKESDYFISSPPALEDRLWRHPAEIGQLKRINRSMTYFRYLGKASIGVGAYLLWGRDFLKLIF